MSIPKFVASLVAIPSSDGRTLTAARAAEIVAERQARADDALTILETKRAECAAALAAGATLDDPAVERAYRERDRAEAAHGRALDALHIAEAEHGRAVEGERRANNAAQWNGAERLAKVHAAAAENFTAAVTAAAEARRALEKATADLYRAIPDAIKSLPHFGIFSDGTQAKTEMERLDLIPDWRRAAGTPKAAPLPEIARGMHAMLKQARKSAGDME